MTNTYLPGAESLPKWFPHSSTNISIREWRPLYRESKISASESTTCAPDLQSRVHRLLAGRCLMGRFGWGPVGTLNWSMPWNVGGVEDIKGRIWNTPFWTEWSGWMEAIPILGTRAISLFLSPQRTRNTNRQGWLACPPEFIYLLVLRLLPMRSLLC